MSSTALRTPLTTGQREAHRSGHANIAIQRTTATTYMVVVEYASTGARVDELTSGPYTAEDDARTAARNAYRAFASGRTVEQVIDWLNAQVASQIDRAGRRGNVRRVTVLNKLAGQLATPAQAKTDADMLAGIAGNMRAASFADLYNRHAAAMERDRTEVRGQADLFETAGAR